MRKRNKNRNKRKWCNCRSIPYEGFSRRFKRDFSNVPISQTGGSRGFNYRKYSKIKKLPEPHLFKICFKLSKLIPKTSISVSN